MGHYDELYHERASAMQAEKAKKQEALEETPHFKQCRELQKLVENLHVKNFNGTMGGLGFLLSFTKRGPKSITSKDIQRVRTLLGLPPDSK